MNVIIFGAAGGIGRYAVKHALAKGYQVTAYLRDKNKLNRSDKKLRIVEGEISDYAAVLNALEDQDAVIWCIGIPLRRKYDKMRSLEGHQILVRAMKEAGVKRLVDWGTPSVPFEKDNKSFVTVIPGIMAGIALTAAKKEMTDIGKLIQASGLDWTLVRFMAPKDTPYTGNVKVGFGDVKMNFAISREDIGWFMAEQVESKQYLHSMPIIGS